MSHRFLAVAAVTALAGAAAAALPGTASAAQGDWRCAATPLTGTLLGQPLQVPSAGSMSGACRAETTLPSLQLPGALTSLLNAELLSSVTNVTQAGAFAGAGLASLDVGALPIPIGPIAVPQSLKRIEVTLPGLSGPVAAVDLTPAIDAITSLPSKPLLDLGVLYSNVTGTCEGGKPVLSGGSRLLSADILGLPVDASKTVDTTVNLLDTSSIALSTLDLSLAKVTLLGGTVDVGTGAVLGALKPILEQLPPLQIPPQLAHVKLTAASQERVDGMLIQRALRAQVSLAGQSIADLSLGQAAVGAETACADAPALALQCTKRKLALIDVLPEGDRVRLYGAADRSLAGRTVRIVFRATGETVARVKVGRSGSFTTTAPMPPEDVRHTNRARYVARVGGERSLKLKLMRRMVVEKVRSHGRKVTIAGRVIQPLADPVQTITLKRRVTCHRLRVVKRFRPASDGSFSVTVRKPRNLAATVYRLQTRVRQSYANPKLYPTFTLPRAVDL